MAIVLIVFLVVFVAMGAASVSMSTSGTRGGADHVQGSVALYLAESGIEWAARELFDTGDPQEDCEALEAPGNQTNVNDGGAFAIIGAEVVFEDGEIAGCRVTSRGFSNPASRTLVGLIPRRVLDGNTGGGGNLFDDSNDDFNCPNNVDCEDGAITLRRPSSPGDGPSQGSGNTSTQADASGLIEDDFQAGDTVYFASNIDWDPSDNPAGNEFFLELRNNIAECSVVLPDLLSGACAAAPGHPLYDGFDLVWIMGDDFDADDINSVRLNVDWSGDNSSDWITLTNGCIGREARCSGDGDDPTEGGGWDEDP